MEDIFNVNEVISEPNRFAVSISTVTDSRQQFNETDVSFAPVPGRPSEQYVLWGDDNQLPYHVISTIGEDEIMAQNKFFNVLTCYGAGLKLMDREQKQPTRDPEILSWQLRNALPTYMLEQATDMKYFFFTVTVLILSRDGKQINKIRHKEACDCRLARADKDGVISRVYYANWRENPTEVEAIPLLDFYDPIGDLRTRMGLEPDARGRMLRPTADRKFAVITRFPTPGLQYYPVPYYTALFRGDWFDIKRLIGTGKKYKLRNHASIKYHVEVHRDYWNSICEEEGITDPVKQKERVNKEKQNIRDFICGIENSGKHWITGFYVDVNGKETHMVRINLIDPGKEGGDWSEDIAEAANTICYCDNIHPNLVGATPGKTQTNNSGSDKRELFTLKQSLEIPFHDIMLLPIHLVMDYNGWSDKVYPDVPMILLTTLDQNTDAVKKSPSTGDVDDPNDTNKE